MESSWLRIRLTKAVHGFLDDVRWIDNASVSCPTQIAQLVPFVLALLAACDAVDLGMGGVAFIPTNDHFFVPVL